jgi:hypothetical protein
VYELSLLSFTLSSLNDLMKQTLNRGLSMPLPEPEIGGAQEENVIEGNREDRW